MPQPFFSVVITTYNRARIVCRCIDACLAQDFSDFELVVVDDGSSDDTRAVLRERYDDGRLRVVAHPDNRGINPARHTGSAAARGEWVVVVDSDDELLPGALARLRELIEGLPPGVRVLRSRQLHDDGHVTPRFVPDGPYGYEGRIRWAETEGGNDAARCIERAVFAETPYVDGRRGAMETLFELNLAERETSVCVEDVLTAVHADAPDSWLRAVESAEVIPRLRREAPDMLWMAETVLSRHGDALRRWGPHQYVTVLRIAATQAFILGQRRRGARYSLRALRRKPLTPAAWITLLLGLLGPGPTARGAVAYRRLAASR
ncbi:MAG TPA: glycosyltransferase family 2 protein [Solirubrobacterales bacterium]|nr:glycosyltransferase family 2 protein [Solirubrobacterales bacterium]